ncbi:DUF2628 domain-containing protein [Brevibacillus migulae]|uniref:DUF2628 domain-containing protein n=1 Tax=Brevibacillus migulae TaxID=1644114 RepID=UPI00106E7995|nr:DUF2628 domain-containing protein [Brevibacillus migulae]
MYCTQCGEVQQTGASYCHACGKTLHDPTANAGNTAGVQEMEHAVELGAEEKLRLFVGKNHEHYLKKWNNAKDPARRAGWSWVGFLFGFFWFGYRKMYAYVAGMIGAFFLIDMIDILIGRADSNYITTGIAVVCGLYCNAMYYQHAQKKIAKLSQQHHDPQALAQALVKEGGGSWKGVGIAFLAFIGYAFIAGFLFW